MPSGAGAQDDADRTVALDKPVQPEDAVSRAVPAQPVGDSGDDTQPIPTPRADPTGPAAVRLRFGPGVPAAVAPAPHVDPSPTVEPGRRRRTEALIHTGLAVALVGILVWLLWPSGPVRAKQVTVRTTSAVVSCDGVADLAATVRTNGRPGRLHYRWIRNDGTSSGPLTAQLKRHQRSVDLPLRWSFRGAGTYAAEATVMVENRPGDAGPLSASTRFTYGCPAS